MDVLKKKFTVLLIASILLLNACSSDNKKIEVKSINYFQTIDLVTNVMVHDIFSPPVASRIYAYPNIAAYEIIAQNSTIYKTLVGQLPEFDPIPKCNDDKVNLGVSALVAHITLSAEMVFSKETLYQYRDSLYNVWKKINEEEFIVSKKYGEEVAQHVNKWIQKDNYGKTRTMPKYYLDKNDPSRWQPTPPIYMNGIEPHWREIRTLILDSASQFRPLPPPKFSLEKDSEFYKELLEVYDIGEKITISGDKSNELEIARFWDCNPFVSVTRGHLMFAVKKISPGAHWIGITKIACVKKDFNLEKSINAFTITSIGIFDAFISCWDEKYRSNLVRPETLINLYLDDKWRPILQTPPFPEYTSGHSVVSGCASTILTSIFGNDFDFLDDTEIEYGLPIRTFHSFEQAANEAAISRLYGGIHYRSAIEEGLKQGRNIGEHINYKLSMFK